MNYIYSWIYTAVRSDVDANIGERNLTVSSPPPSLSLTTGVIFYSEVVFDVFHATYRRVPRESILLRPKKILNGITYMHEGVTPASVSKSEVKRMYIPYWIDPYSTSDPIRCIFLPLFFSFHQIYILLAAIDLITRSIAYSSSQIGSIRILYSAAFIWIKMETRVGRAIIQKSLQQANQIFERNGAIWKQIEQRSILTREIRCWNIKSKVLSISKCTLHDFVRDRMNAQST